MILLGEKHDDIRHHQAQLVLMQAMHRSRPIASVILEMLPSSQQSALSRAQMRAQQQLARDAATSPEQIRQILQWPDRWDWTQYAGPVAWMLRERIPIYGGNLNDAEIATILRGAQPLRGKVSTSPQVSQALAGLIGGHHEHTQNSLSALVQAQQFKDRRMAQALIKNRKPALLLAGNIHVSKAVGVPLHLQDYDQANFASVMLVSSPGDVDPAKADYFWIVR